MRSLNKVARKTIRLTAHQDQKAEKAAKIISQEKGQNVGASTLIRDLAMPSIDAILERAAKNGS